MGMEFGWWNRDPATGKYEVKALVHGGNIQWRRHQGHHTPWEPHQPSEEDRARLVAEAERRLPRRLITQRQFEEIRQLSSQSGSGRITGRRHRPLPDR
ncbi:MAG: hypothetical protein FJ381_00480 [Verrucomicrobia bacterium]|nr:hypothetical protein [Verrucomicrobiota bacterium]